MTDKEKKSKIADILMDFQEEYSNDVINRPMLANLYAGNILSFIDSMQEEPISEDLEEASKNYALNNTPWDDCKDEMQESFKAGAKWQKAKDESTTEDLGEYINELSKQFPEVSFAKLSRIAVRVAKWQKEQDQSTIELAEEHVMLAGMEKMKGQMMKEAIDGVLSSTITGSEQVVSAYVGYGELGKNGDKVKVIVIKED